MGTSVQLLLIQLHKAKLSLELKQAGDEQSGRDEGRGPAPNAHERDSRRALPQIDAAKPKKANAMKRIRSDFAKAVEDGKAASLLKKPLIVEGGVGAPDEFGVLSRGRCGTRRVM